MAFPIVSFDEATFRLDIGQGQCISTQSVARPDDAAICRFIWAFGGAISILLESSYKHYFEDEDSDYDEGRGRSFENQPWFYGEVGRHLSRAVGVDGEECVLRFICELQSRPIQNWSLAGQLLSLFFTPQYGQKNALAKYQDAARIGRTNQTECGSTYDRCAWSVFELAEAYNAFADLSHNEL